jgi:hypothetical protein
METKISVTRPHGHENVTGNRKQLNPSSRPVISLVHNRLRRADVQFLGVKLKAFRLSRAVGANDHVEQQNAVLLAEDAVAAAYDHLVAMFTNKGHAPLNWQTICQRAAVAEDP